MFKTIILTSQNTSYMRRNEEITTSERVNAMSNKKLNFSVLVGIMNKPKVDDGLPLVFKHDGLSQEIAEALREIRIEDRKAAVKAAAIEIMNVVTEAERKKACLVDSIRAARATEKKALESLKEIDRAKEYAQLTDNYLPLAMVAGFNFLSSELFGADKECFLIPVDFDHTKGTVE